MCGNSCSVSYQYKCAVISACICGVCGGALVCGCLENLPYANNSSPIISRLGEWRSCGQVMPTAEECMCCKQCDLQFGIWKS